MRLRTDDGVVVAHLVDGILIKKVRESRHMLRSPRAWAFDKSIIETANKHGAKYIRIEAGDTGKTYTVTMKRFIEKAMPLRRGFNSQLALVLKFWDTVEPLSENPEKQLPLI